MAKPSILDAYLENQTALKRFLRRFVKHREDAEDLAQEAFLRAFAAESLHFIKSPKAFLFTVARNLAINERAKLANATTASLEDFADQSVIEDTGQVTPEEDMDARQRVRLLAKAMASLPPQCSRVFMLRKVHGLSYKEIAYRLGISVSTVEKHAALGLLRCSEYLRGQGCDVNSAARGSAKSLAGEPSGRVAKLELKRRDQARDA